MFPVNVGATARAWSMPAPPAAPTDAADAPPRLDHVDKSKIRMAAYRATQVYPGAAGKILSQYLIEYEQWGFRVAGSALVAQLVEQILTTEVKR